MSATRTRRPWVIAGLPLACWLLASGEALAAPAFHLDVPLTNAAQAQALVAQYGGQISGGKFDANGWTTTSRDDLIQIPLPAGLDTSIGSLEAGIANIETTFPYSGSSFSFELVALDPFGAGQAKLPPAGRAHLAAGYMGECSDCGTHYWNARAYFNLFDPSCTDWHNCTTETASTPQFIQPATSYTYSFVWAGTKLEAWFSDGSSTKYGKVDLGATSPAGVLSESQLYLTINNCGGGAKQLACGSWDESNNRGGPLGVTYSKLVLDIPGDDGGTPPPDAGPTDGSAGAAPDSAPASDAGLGGTGGTGSTGGAGSGGADAGPAPGVAPTSEDSGCGCHVAERRGRGAASLGLALLFALRRRARRSDGRSR